MISVKPIVAQRQLNPENPTSYTTVVTGRDEEYPVVQRSLTLWEGPRQTQEQFSRRISEVSIKVEAQNAKCAEFLAQYSKEEMADITLGPAPVVSSDFRPFLETHGLNDDEVGRSHFRTWWWIAGKENSIGCGYIKSLHRVKVSVRIGSPTGDN
jgi:hypothetical protein